MWWAFLGAAIAISVSPGAGAIQSMATGLAHGVRRGYWSIAGLEIGLMMQLAVVALGLGTVLVASAAAFAAVKWVGVAYLVYLAVRQWRTASVALTEQMIRPDGGRLSLLLRGVLINVTNPKGLVFLIAALPPFIEASSPLLPQYTTIGATMVAVDLVVMGLYAGMAARLVRLLHTAKRQAAFGRVFSGFFATAAVALSLMRRASA
ncbi:MAG: homoserine/homoserine lactone efflux protein [Mycobacterium sp.]|nr:homoserine/homoserine lactone efflux protein [Mycobacterium sp.]